MRFRYFNTFLITLFYFGLFTCMLHGKVQKKNVTLIKLQGKIVGGEAVNIKSYPFAVQLLNMGRLCGGVIINSWSVLTAAHCLAFNNDTDVMSIQAGARFTYDFNSDRYKVLSFVIHEEYNKEQVFSCDIALIFVEKPIKFGKKVKKGILVPHDKWMNKQERTFIVTGWGYTKHEGELSHVGIQMARLRYIRPEECSKLNGDHKLTKDMFCLYGEGKRDTCQGDSGGGVLWNDMLVGLTSHGDGCANKGKPSVYTNLWVFRNWIKKHVEAFIEQYCNERYRSKKTNWLIQL